MLRTSVCHSTLWVVCRRVNVCVRLADVLDYSDLDPLYSVDRKLNIVDMVNEYVRGFKD